MKVLKSLIIALLLTATQALAYGGGADGEGPSLLMILFMGFFAVIIVFQLFPAAVLFAGMVKGFVSSRAKEGKEAAADNSDTH